MKTILRLALALTAIVSTCSYGMFKTVKSAFSRRKTYSQRAENPYIQVFHIWPKTMLNQTGKTVVYSAEQQVIDLLEKTSDGSERLKNTLAFERERILWQADKEYEKKLKEYEKILKRLEQQVITLLDESEYVKHSLECERKWIFQQADREYEKRLKEFEKETERELRDIRYFDKPTLNNYLKGLKDKVKKETRE
jgi:hypothetical protein